MVSLQSVETNRFGLWHERSEVMTTRCLLTYRMYKCCGISSALPCIPDHLDSAWLENRHSTATNPLWYSPAVRLRRLCRKSFRARHEHNLRSLSSSPIPLRSHKANIDTFNSWKSNATQWTITERGATTDSNVWTASRLTVVTSVNNRTALKLVDIQCAHINKHSSTVQGNSVWDFEWEALKLCRNDLYTSKQFFLLFSNFD